jgi:hypothetical protein
MKYMATLQEVWDNIAFKFTNEEMDNVKWMESLETIWNSIASKIANEIIGSNNWWWELSPEDKKRESDNDKEHHWIDYTVMFAGETPIICFKYRCLVSRFDPPEYVMNLMTYKATKNSQKKKEISQALKTEIFQFVCPLVIHMCESKRKSLI